jgi:hypothetical protein
MEPLVVVFYDDGAKEFLRDSEGKVVDCIRPPE